jgi:cysteine synthase A
MQEVVAPFGQTFFLIPSLKTILTLDHMSDRTYYYVTGAFILGAALAILYQNQQIATEKELHTSKPSPKELQHLLAKLSKINDLDTLRKSLAEIEQNLETGGGNIRDGVEGCIGNTPLIKIKSLSDATGCEILAKAEVPKFSLPD